MTRLFTQIRYGGYAAVIIFSAVVLGVSAYLANQFLPDLHHDFTIFALIPPSYTILLSVILLFVSNPRAEIVHAFVTGVLWLIMGAWTADFLGSSKCSAQVGSTTPTTHGTMSANLYCELSKVQEAFAWVLFVLFALWFFIVISLTRRSLAMGREFIWTENVNLLPWFGQAPSWPGMAEGQYPEQYRPFYGYPGYQQYYPQISNGTMGYQHSGVAGSSYPGGHHVPTSY
ncbi:unnamed protein product [Peniophora sp. CBMAI 1063]|nr:unnamed protein product [Peniophora sp. CBMAI 1063]